MHAGFAARCGVEAALLAEAGVSADPDVTEGRYGFLALYGGETSCIGDRNPEGHTDCAMETDPVLRKPWPCCAYTHRAIEAALKLAGMSEFDAATIVRGTIRIPEPFFRVAPFLEPAVPAEARFSVLYCVASALIDGSVSPASFDQAAITRPEVRALMQRFSIDAYDAGTDLQDLSPMHPDSVGVELADGSEYRETIADVKGGAGNPLREADIREKFLRCGGAADLAETLLSGPAAQQFQFSPHSAIDPKRA